MKTVICCNKVRVMRYLGICSGCWKREVGTARINRLLSVIGSFGAALTVGLKRGGLLLSLLVLPLYVPTLIFGAEVARRGAEGQGVATPLVLLAGLTLATVAERSGSSRRMWYW